MNLSLAIEQLTADSSPTRLAAAEDLMKLGESAQPAAYALVVATSDSDDQVAQTAAATLEELGPPPASDVERLAGLLDSGSTASAYWAATLLGRLEAQGAAAAPALAAALDESRPMEVRQKAAWALGKIGVTDDEVTAALKQAAASDDARLARLANTALKATP